ncbi:anti-repressor SinI family protein [Heyndrickxia sporothermodurans]
MGIELKNRKLQNRSEEWRKLLLEAKKLGLTPKEIRYFFQIKKSNILSNNMIK